MKEKILFITNKSPHYRIPFFNRLSRELNIKFIFTHEKKEINGLEADYVSLKGIGYKKFRVHPELIEVIKKENPSRVFLLPLDPLHLIDNLIIFKYLRKKNIPFFIFNERWDYKNTLLKYCFSDFLYKKIIKRAYKIFVAGIKSKEWVLSKGVKKERIILAPNASQIEYKKNKVDKKKKEFLEKHNLKKKKKILYLGRLIDRKGIFYLIEALYKMKNKDAVLILVGGEDFYNLGAKSEESKLREMVKRKNLNQQVIFVGKINPKEAPIYYKMADIFVYPSITKKIGEPWGLAINEAMQFGLPVISTDAVGASYDLVEEGKNGFVIPEKNSKELKNKIEKLLNSDSLKQRMGEKSREIIQKRNNYKNMSEAFIKELNKGCP